MGLPTWGQGKSPDGAVGAAARARLGAYAHVIADDPVLAAAAVATALPATRLQVFDPLPARDDVPLAG